MKKIKIVFGYFYSNTEFKEEWEIRCIFTSCISVGLRRPLGDVQCKWFVIIRKLESFFPTNSINGLHVL